MLFYSSIEDLKVILSNGVLKTNRYDILFSLPPSMQEKWGTKYTKFLPLICNIPIPSLALERVDDEIYAESKKIVTGIKYEELELDSYIDAKGEVIEFWQDWLMSTVNLDNRTATWYENYICPEWTVYLHKKVQGVKFFNIYPILISERSLSYENDNQVPILKVRLCFEYMRDLKTPPSKSNKNNDSTNDSIFDGVVDTATTPLFDTVYNQTKETINKYFNKAFDWLSPK